MLWPSPRNIRVPQGSVLGPILFLVYINDLPDCVSSNVRLFADDTILYRQITNSEQIALLQKDLGRLEEWEATWQMQFHPQKCQVVRITRSKSPIVSKYYLHNQCLESVSSAKYLGVTLSHDLSWNNHIANVKAKGSSTLGFLRRNIKVSSPAIKERAYMGLVRPNLEYCATVWDPITKTGSKSIEMVQRRAARWVLHRYHNTSSVTQMLDHLQWRSLEYRRTDARLIIRYKMVNGLMCTNPLRYLKPVNRTTRNVHTLGYIQPTVRTEAYRLSFFPRTCVNWNILPVALAQAPSTDAFRQGVKVLDHVSPL